MNFHIDKKGIDGGASRCNINAGLKDSFRKRFVQRS
jgi:hypothetical protein